MLPLNVWKQAVESCAVCLWVVVQRLSSVGTQSPAVVSPIKSLHPPEQPVTAAVHWIAIKETPCKMRNNNMWPGSRLLFLSEWCH